MSHDTAPFCLPLEKVGFHPAILGSAETLKPLDVIFESHERTGEGPILHFCSLETFAKAQITRPLTVNCNVPFPQIEGVFTSPLMPPASTDP